MKTAWTIGHGQRSLPELIALLLAARIDLLIDVRRHPGSRSNPQFALQSLEDALNAADISYWWRGHELGGRRSSQPVTPSKWRNRSFAAYAAHIKTPLFAEALGEAEQAIASGHRVAFMCAETLWWRCHRRLIADVLSERGYEVRHLLNAAPGAPHPDAIAAPAVVESRATR